VVPAPGSRLPGILQMGLDNGEPLKGGLPACGCKYFGRVEQRHCYWLRLTFVQPKSVDEPRGVLVGLKKQ